MFRTLTAAAVAVLLAPCGFAQAEKDDKVEDKKDDKKEVNLYPLTKGTKWEMVLKVAGQELEGTQEVTEVSKPEKGERAVATIETSIGGQEMKEEMSADEKGVYRHSFQGQKLDSPMVAVKYPVKAGSKWSEKIKVMGQEVEADFEMKEAEELKVAAGKYTAYPVEMTIKAEGQTIVATNWYADGVGLVKQEVELGGMTIVMELKKFTAGK